MGIYTFYSLSFEPRTKRCMTGKSQFLHRHDWMVKITWVPPWQRSRTDRIKEITSYWWRSDLWGFLKPHRFVVVVSLGLRASPVFTHPNGRIVQGSWQYILYSNRVDFLTGRRLQFSWRVDNHWLMVICFRPVRVAKDFSDSEKPCKEQEIQQESLRETRKPYQTFVIFHTVTDVTRPHI